MLSGNAKDEGARINKLVLNDLKGLDKLAKVRARRTPPARRPPARPRSAALRVLRAQGRGSSLAVEYPPTPHSIYRPPLTRVIATD